MAVSTQPKLKGNLRDALALRPAIKGEVQVSWGFPKSPEKEFILLGDIRDDGQESAAMGMQRRDERYTLEVIVKVEKNGTDQEATTLRAYALAGEVENTLRADATVGNAVLMARVTGVGLVEFDGDQVRIAVLTVLVGCKARI
jgi:limonene-1,2-epoxide hydrolase